MRILLIEDDAFKAKRICRYLGGRAPQHEIISARSVSAGLTKLFSSEPPDAVLLDMSLSTFDVGPRETGGRPQNFGGIAILEHMARRNSTIPVVLITQFETFPKDGRELDLDAIRADLSSRFQAIFKGLIYYSSRETEWERLLEQFLMQIKNGGGTP
ncbi:MAG: response regulator [Xanthobacteraceae bacterium]